MAVEKGIADVCMLLKEAGVYISTYDLMLGNSFEYVPFPSGVHLLLNCFLNILVQIFKACSLFDFMYVPLFFWCSFATYFLYNSGHTF